MITPLARQTPEQVMAEFDGIFGNASSAPKNPTPYRISGQGGGSAPIILLPADLEISQVLEKLGRPLGERYLLILSHFYSRGLLRKKVENKKGNFLPAHNAVLRQLGGETYAALMKRAIEWKHLSKSPMGYLSGKRSTAYMVNREVLSVSSQRRYSLSMKAAIRVRRAYQEGRRAGFAAKHAVYRKIADSICRLSFDYEAACRYVGSIADPEDKRNRRNVIEQLMLGELVWATDQQGRNYTVLVSVPRDIRQFFSCGGDPLFVVDIASSQPMLHVLLYPSDSDEKSKYQAFVEGGSFWAHMNKLAGGRYDLNDEDQKAELKEAIFREVFYAYRESPKGTEKPYAVLFKAEFPILWEEINAHKKAKGYKASGALAKEMQRTEAWAVFDAINALHNKPYPLISIHDVIVTTHDGVGDVANALRAAFITAALNPKLAAKRLTVTAEDRQRMMRLTPAKP